MAVPVVLCTGQSNAEGVSVNDLPAYLGVLDTGIKVWTGAAFANLQNGVNNDSLGGTPNTWGPESEFLYRWRLANPSTTVYLIKLSVGGTSLENDWDPTAGANQYSAMTGHVVAALATLVDPVVIADLWMQGESDAITSSAMANAYAANLAARNTAVRTDWGANANMPHIIGNILSHWLRFATINAAQATVAAADSRGLTKVVATESFSWTTGHFLAAGQVDLGRRFYQAYAAGAHYVPMRFSLSA